MAVATNDCDTSSLEWLLQVGPSMKEKTTQASWLMLLNAILMGVVVFIGAYAPRYRRHPVIGALFVGAITLFLPIVSITVTAVDGVHDLIRSLRGKIHCSEGDHLVLVFLWTGVVVVIGINATEVVAGDAREGRNVGPPIMLLVKAIWTAYLTFSTMLGNGGDDVGGVVLLGQLFVIMFAKLVLKYAAFYNARRSFALGRNPCLIAGYMVELRQPQMVAVPAAPPALIVMGETEVHVQVEQQPHWHGSSGLKRAASIQAQANINRREVMTLDRVWGQKTLDDLCFSFALFKMLRCRFAKYNISEAGFAMAGKFFRETLLIHGDHYERVFGIITDELSFINDYYYSSLPIYYSHPLLPALGITLSLWIIGYCFYLIVNIAPEFRQMFGQITCEVALPGCANNGYDAGGSFFGMGSLSYDLVPLCLVVAVLVLAETREVVSYICSNWTKLALIYHQINQAWWQRPRVVQKCVSCLLKYRRCKLVRNWNDKMKQCSVLAIPRRPRRSTPHLLLRRLLRLPDMQKKVKVPTAVKTAIFEAIKGESSSIDSDTCSSSSSEHHGDDDRAHGGWRIRPPPPPVPVSQQLLYACTHGRRPAYTILVWHIATSVFEASQQLLQAPSLQQQQPASSDDHKIVATHLSRYCAYLVSSCPELLPDDAEWCRGLYGEVKKNADHVVAKLPQGHRHHQLVEALSADANHEVLRNGARLGKELVESKMVGWEALARFWSRMLLYVAPSENLEAHAEAISHGGELITLLWALLAHAGIVDRVDDDDADAAVVAAAAEGLC